MFCLDAKQLKNYLKAAKHYLFTSLCFFLKYLQIKTSEPACILSRKLYSTEKRSDLPERAMKQISELYNFSRNIFSPYEAWDQSWDYGRLHALPLWPEFVCISRYGKNTKYTHYCPTVNAIEFPLEGNLNIALTGENITLSYSPGWGTKHSCDKQFRFLQENFLRTLRSSCRSTPASAETRSWTEIHHKRSGNGIHHAERN